MYKFLLRLALLPAAAFLALASSAVAQTAKHRRSGTAGHAAGQLPRRDGKRARAHHRGAHQGAFQGQRGLAPGPRPLPLHALRRRAGARPARQDPLRVRAACGRDRGIPGGLSGGRERHRRAGARADGRDQGRRRPHGRERAAQGQIRSASAARAASSPPDRRASRSPRGQADRSRSRFRGRASRKPPPRAPARVPPGASPEAPRKAA